MRVEVVYALAAEQHLVPLEVAPGTTAAEAVRASGLGERFGGADPDASALGIFGRLCDGDQVLRPGDRVELLRPLEMDPREARRLRAARGRGGRQ